MTVDIHHGHLADELLGPSLCAIGFIEIGHEMPKQANHSDLSAVRHISTDSVVLWKIQKFDWLIPETK